jgi:hypothetical protein
MVVTQTVQTLPGPATVPPASTQAASLRTTRPWTAVQSLVRHPALRSLLR